MTILKEPLLHFTIIGVILFSGYAGLNEKGVQINNVEPVRISEGDLRWLKQAWSSQWLREPNIAELKGLVNDQINERLMAREAQELGLDNDDIIIRRRLAQKLKFLVEDTAQFTEPGEQKLRQFYTQNASRFEKPGKVSFKQIYFNPERRKDATADSTAALALIKAKGEGSSIVGDRLILGDQFANTDELSMSGMFGANFAHEVFTLGVGEWTGPIKSGYGLHLILVTQRIPAELMPFGTVKEAVLAEWRAEQQIEFSRNYLRELRKKYGVSLDDNVKAVLGSKQLTNVASR